ncbi:hypothetical protein [Saccharicrinis aurantiacus]|uniref:hypothetical protein n=1 Tax=Saccharicrinis aurantiacus TaxID=1849719 RepID=UPI0024908C9E|nr:hypothetical protein [Saccharicrinis aurantiacus]
MKCFKKIFVLACAIAISQWSSAQENQQQRKRHTPEEIIALIDLDNDGKVSLSELEQHEQFNRLSSNFDRIDKDGDGFITASELETAQQNQMERSKQNASQKEIGKWDDGKITIDGGVKDWGEMLKYYDPESKIMYHYKNDESYLYLAFQVKETAIQNKIMSSGFNLNVNASTKPKLRATIIFPVMQGQSRSKENGGSEMGNKQSGGGQKDRSQRMEERKQLWLFLMGAINTEGFVSGVTSISKNNGSDKAFTYDIAWDDLNQMNIEFKIPIAELVEPHDKQKSADKIEFMIEPRVLAMQMPEGGRGPGMGGPGGQGGGGRGMGGPGMGGPGGGMRPGGASSMQGQGGNKPDMQTMMSEQAFKFKFQLSTANR